MHGTAPYPIVSDAEKASWTISTPVLCRCIGAKPVTTKIRGGATPSFILELVNVETNEKVICYFNARKTKSGHSVKPESKFAKLYRITTGNNPMPRYNKAQQLLKHFIGHEFIAEYKAETASNNQPYFKTTSIKPNKPKPSEQWKEDGELLGKYDWSNRPSKQPKKWKVTGKRLESKWKVAGKLLESAITGKAQFYLVSSGFSMRNNVLTYTRERVTTCNHSPAIPKQQDSYKTTVKEIDGVKHYQYHQQPDETEQQYQERVIDESMAAGEKC